MAVPYTARTTSMRNTRATHLLKRMAAETGTVRKQTYDELVTLLYEDLRRRARRQLGAERGRTLRPTALVHDAYERLLRYRMPFQDRAHFLNAAAEAMRRCLIERARRRQAEKRGSGRAPAPLDEAAAVGFEIDPDRLIDIATAVESLPPEQARLVDLRYFAGFSVEETAAIMRLNPETLKKRWQVVKTILYDKLEQGGQHDSRTAPGARPHSRRRAERAGG